MDLLRTIMRSIVRFVVVWLVSTLALNITAWILPGVAIHAIGTVPAWMVALAAAFVLGLVNALLRPLILLLALPLGFFVLFALGFFVNAITLWLTAQAFPTGMEIANWFAAFTGGFVLATTASFISTLLGIEDAGSFFEGVIERNLTRQRGDVSGEPTTGLVMLEIDGLSYYHIQRAIDAGYMPNVAEMIRRDGYQLSRVDCGLPSQTSACQAGILFGDNYDIPGYRWYDKAQGKLFVSASDAAEINARYAHGRGLLRGGASINNLVNGDAEISLMTAADLRGGTDEERRVRARDVYVLLLNPNFFMRVIGLSIGESILEVWQYFRDVIKGTQPRLNRLAHFYPFVRASTTVLMREVSGMLTMMQIVRGEPAMYTTWLGYDEVAHHSGPWSGYAFGTLRGFDRLLGSVRQIIKTKAPRPYELILLSDHGQSFGPTFRMRYGYTLKDFIERHMPEGTVVAHSAGGDDGSQSLARTAAELGNIQAQGVGGRMGQATTRQLQRAAERSAQEASVGEPDQTPATSREADVTFCGSGNLAQVYFHAFPHRASLEELHTAFPGLVDALVAHEGVGIVVATGEDGAVALGKDGTRNLQTGAVRGEDPLVLYGDADLRAWQIRRVAEFPSAGDLVIISTIYPDGSVAALEELIGSHGGLGGEQTDAFILHPADMTVPPTRNAVDLFPVLDARRDRPARPTSVPVPSRPRDDWSPNNLAAGLREIGEWLELAFNALTLDRPAYGAITVNGLMTGPAILLSVVGELISVLMEDPAAGGDGFAGRILSRYGLWLLTVGLTYGAARALRGRANFTQTFRVMGFAQTVNILELLRIATPIEPLVVALVTLYALIANWLAVAEAHRFSGWRTLALPVIYFGVLGLGSRLLASLPASLPAALETLIRHMNLLP